VRLPLKALPGILFLSILALYVSEAVCARQLTHTCEVNKGQRPGLTEVYAHTMPAGASCWDGVSSGGVAIADNTSAPEPAKPRAQQTSPMATQFDGGSHRHAKTK
jgi:hypothetical protein